MNINLENLNLSDLNLDSTTLNDVSQSNLSPGSSRMTIASQQSIGGLMLPPSASSLSGGPVVGSDLFGIRGNSELAANIQPARLLEDDLFVIGDDGTMNFDDLPTRESSAGVKNTTQSVVKGKGSENADIPMVCIIDLLFRIIRLTLPSLIELRMLTSHQSKAISTSIWILTLTLVNHIASSSTRLALRL